jgi:flavorubredoxin
VTPEGFTFNQFLVRGDEPLLFHTGMRAVFPLVAEAVGALIPLESLRWISFGHVEADECGSMNMWLSTAPESQVVFGALGCDVSLNDLCDRPPRVLEGEVLDLGGKRVRQISTPHVPHGWEAQVLFEETTGTLLCGDLFSQVGAPPPLSTEDLVDPAMAAEAMFHATCLAPHTATTIRALGDLEPTTLAVMHGASYQGDGRKALYELAAAYEGLTASAAGAG